MIELLARIAELEAECAGWRQEGVGLRQLVRDYEPDKERMEAYRRDLEEIGKTIGCDHIDDGLQRCVESTIDDLTADNARLRELLQTFKHRLDKRWREGTRVDAYARGYQDGLEAAEVIFDNVFQSELAKGE